MRIRWRNFELPSSVILEKETKSDEYGRFSVEPFERGFGHTIGNGLRRVLLSSIEGTAITAVKIGGVSHEFDALDGLYEDVTDIILNLKRLRISYSGDKPITCRVNVSKKGVVTGADVECEGDAEAAWQAPASTVRAAKQTQTNEQWLGKSRISDLRELAIPATWGSRDESR